MTPEQIENWRRVMATMIGPYAFIMPESQIEEMRDNLQARVEHEFPECPFEVGDTVTVRHKGKAYLKKIHGRSVTVKWAWGGTAIVDVESLEPYEKG